MTIEELKEYNQKIQSAEGNEYTRLRRLGLKRYADESGDKWLKIAVDVLLHLHSKVPWGYAKIIRITIGKDKVIWNHETKTLKGPKRIVDKLKKANDRYAEDNRYSPDDTLWDGYDFLRSLVRDVFGEDAKCERVESYPRNPLYDLYREMGEEVDIVY